MYGSFQSEGHFFLVFKAYKRIALGLNPYDVRRSCDRAKDKDGPLCYKQMVWIENFMNRPEIKKALGANSQVTFESCNLEVNKAFLGQGDSMHNSALLLPELLSNGVRL